MNISIANFQKMANGKYNAGELTLDKNKNLSIVNNHVTMRFLNNKTVDPTSLRAVKEAFVAALKDGGVEADAIASVRAELGLVPNADGSAPKSAFKPLTRVVVRDILDRYSSQINAGKDKAVVSNRYAGGNANVQEKNREIAREVNLATVRKRVETNANLAADFLKNDLKLPTLTKLDISQEKVKAAVLYFAVRRGGELSFDDIVLQGVKRAVINACFDDDNVSAQDLDQVKKDLANVRKGTGVDECLLQVDGMLRKSGSYAPEFKGSTLFVLDDKDDIMTSRELETKRAADAVEALIKNDKAATLADVRKALAAPQDPMMFVNFRAICEGRHAFGSTDVLVVDKNGRLTAVKKGDPVDKEQAASAVKMFFQALKDGGLGDGAIRHIEKDLEKYGGRLTPLLAGVYFALYTDNLGVNLEKFHVLANGKHNEGEIGLDRMGHYVVVNNHVTKTYLNDKTVSPVDAFNIKTQFIRDLCAKLKTPELRDQARNELRERWGIPQEAMVYSDLKANQIDALTPLKRSEVHEIIQKYLPDFAGDEDVNRMMFSPLKNTL